MVAIADAYVSVRPDFEGFDAAVRGGIKAEAIGDVVGKSIGSRIKSRLRGVIGDSLSGGTGDAQRQGAKAGETYGGAFGQSVNRAAGRALKSLPTVKVDADTGPAAAKVAELRSRLETLRDARVGLDVDATSALREIAEVRSDLASLRGATVDLDVDAASASAELSKISRQVADLDGKTARASVKVDADMAGILRANHGVSTLLTAGLALGPAIIPVAGLAAAAIGGIGTAAVGAAVGGGVLALAFSGVGEAVKALGKADQAGAAEAAANASRRAAATERVREAQLSLANAQRAADRAASDGAQQVADAQADVADARRAASRTAAEGAARVADADRKVAEEQAQSSTRVRSALADVTDARREQSRTAVEGAQRVADAEEQAADRVEAAEGRAVDAYYDLARAQSDLMNAQKALTEARREAREEIEDLSLSVRGAALQERGAEFALQKALARLKEAQGNGASGLELGEARLDVDEAKLRIDEVRERMGDLRAKQAEVDRSGVDGTKQVAAALVNLAGAEGAVAGAFDRRAIAERAVAAERVKAEQDVARVVASVRQSNADAARGVAEAEAKVTAARVAGAQQVAEAQRAAAQARRTADLDNADAARRVTEAQAGVARARQEAAQAQQDAARAVAEAQREVGNATREAAAGLGSQSAAAAAAATAMNNLSPAGQRFATFVHGLRGEFNGLKALAQEGVLPGLQVGIESALQRMPQVRGIVSSTAKAFGGLFADAGRALNDPFWVRFFDYVERTAGPTVTSLGRTVGNLARGFAGLLMAFEPTATSMLGGLESLSVKFAKFGSDPNGSPGFRKFMYYVKQNGPLLGEALKEVATSIGRIIVAAAPLAPVVLTVITNMARGINALPIGLLTGLAVAFTGVNLAAKVLTAGMRGFQIAQLVVTGGLKAFRLVMLGVNLVMRMNPIGLVITGLTLLGGALVLAYKKSETFRDIVDGAWQRVKDSASFAWTKGLKPVFGWLGDAMRVGGERVGDMREAMRAAWDGITRLWRLGVAGVKKMFWDAVGSVLDGAVEMFGWVPGIGPKLRDARDKIAGFRKDANTEFARIRDEEVSVKVSYDAAAARKKAFEGLRASGMTPSQATIAMKGFAHGGPVTGPFVGKRADNVIARVTPNEHVATVDEVRGAGGHASVAAHRALWRRGIATPAIPSAQASRYAGDYADGGPVRFEPKALVPEGFAHRAVAGVAREKARAVAGVGRTIAGSMWTRVADALGGGMGFGPAYNGELGSGTSYMGLMPRASAVARILMKMFGSRGLTSIGGREIRKIKGTNVWSNHSYGYAADLMHKNRAMQPGAAMMGFLKTNWQKFGLKGLIWRQRHYPSPNSAGKPMNNRGDDNQNHYNHIHVDWEGGPKGNVNPYTYKRSASGLRNSAGRPVPALGDGGIVRARTGGVPALLAERGQDEMVLPLPRNWASQAAANGGRSGRMHPQDLQALIAAMTAPQEVQLTTKGGEQFEAVMRRTVQNGLDAEARVASHGPIY